ncbi:MAG: hypothetical protein QOI28_3203 [Mycobacterium sp.]|nr:hypothetical protein [Mycobacterium sp.]
MDWLDVLAMALGVVIAGGLAVLVSPLAAQSDPDMVWEGRVAVGFAALLYVGPLWLGQAATTLGAAVTAGGIWPGWLWGWLVVAPLLGATPPAAALARRVTHGVAGGSSRTDVNRSGAAVQQASNFAWADTAAEPGWELRRTPPLPVTWPPTPDGSAVWFCYAERSVTPETIEVAGTWARITLPDPDEAPVVERLSDAVESLGSQGIQPTTRFRSLDEWRARNVLIAAHPHVTPHLPPAAQP